MYLSHIRVASVGVCACVRACVVYVNWCELNVYSVCHAVGAALLFWLCLVHHNMNVWISLRINIQICVRNVQRHTFRRYFWITKQRATSDVKFRIYSSSHTHILKQPTIFRSTSKWRHEQTPKMKTHNDQYFPFFSKEKNKCCFFFLTLWYIVCVVYFIAGTFIYLGHTQYFYFFTLTPRSQSHSLSSSKHIHNFLFFIRKTNKKSF